MKKIPPYELTARPCTPDAEAAAGFEWAAPEVGTRHRLGRTPTDVPESDYPTCPSCNERMSFYGQLDSIGDDIALADAGLVLVFVCFGCFEATAKVHSA